MAIIKAFKAVRPAPDKVHLVASRSVDAYSKVELNARLSINPYSFLHIIKPEFNDEVKSKSNTNSLLEKIKKKYIKFIDEEIFIHDKKDSIYVYQQISEWRTFTGFVACAAADDYTNNIIKIHEQTLAEKEEKLKEYLEVCDFNAEPVCFGHDNNEVLENYLNDVVRERNTTYDFTSFDKIRHKIWVVDKPNEIENIQTIFKKIGNIYIADGHHRSASSTRLAHWRREQLKNYTGQENFNFFLGIFFSEKQLKIVEFNRLVKDLNGLASDDFLVELKKTFVVHKLHKDDSKPTQLHQINIYVNKCWYSLTPLHGTFNDKDPVLSLDAQILSDNILSPILNIHDLRSDSRVAFVPGIIPTLELEKLVDSGKYAVAFVLFSVSMQQLKDVADSGKIMPPKSTWVEPKLRSGLIVFDLERS